VNLSKTTSHKLDGIKQKLKEHIVVVFEYAQKYTILH